MTDFKKLKVVELRAELASRNLPQAGKRDELIERLEEHEFHHAEPAKDEEMPQAQDDISEDIEIQSPDDICEKIDMKVPVLVSESQAQLPISPIMAPSPVQVVENNSTIESLEAIEEEKRRLRALRFGIDETEAAQVKIEVAIKRLEHALPSRSNHRQRAGIKKHRHISINKP